MWRMHREQLLNNNQNNDKMKPNNRIVYPSTFVPFFKGVLGHCIRKTITYRYGTQKHIGEMLYVRLFD